MIETFPADARVCFFGDSITCHNNFVQRVIAHYKKKYPERRVKFWNCGAAGGIAPAAETYLEDDVLRHDPTHVAIMFGVNDSRRWQLANPKSEARDRDLEDGYQKYVTHLNNICDILLGKGIKVILCTPAPYAEFADTGEAPFVGGHALILRFAEAARAIAKRCGLEVVDYHARLSELYMDEAIYGPDHIHPNDLGQYRMAELFLRSQGEQIEPYRPIAEVSAEAGLTAWAAAVSVQRAIWSAEVMLVKNYGLTNEEKYAVMRKYIEEKRWGSMAYFERLSKQYLEIKPQERELNENVDTLMEAYYDEA